MKLLSAYAGCEANHDGKMHTGCKKLCEMTKHLTDSLRHAERSALKRQAYAKAQKT
jgi:hypothetical protein